MSLFVAAVCKMFQTPHNCFKVLETFKARAEKNLLAV